MSTNYDQIKPAAQLNAVFTQLSALFDEFENKNPRKIAIDCPFCDHQRSTPDFAYKSCTYRKCGQCRSVFLSPRITQEWLGKYYSFMQERFCYDVPQSQREVRINIIMKPRWDLLAGKLKPYIKDLPVHRYMEVGPGVGYFTEVAQKHKYAKEYILVEPDKHCQAYLRELKDAVVLDCLLEDCDEARYGNNDVIFINSVIEHPFSLDVFFGKLNRLLNDNGVIVLVDMHSGGLDIEVLREEAPNVNPYSILQVGSIKGIEALCRNHGLAVKDVFSIGMMDWDILFEHAKEVPHDHPLKGFENILQKKEVRADLQEVLSRHLLTGYNAYLIQNEK